MACIILRARSHTSTQAPEEASEVHEAVPREVVEEQQELFRLVPRRLELQPSKTIQKGMEDNRNRPKRKQNGANSTPRAHALHRGHGPTELRHLQHVEVVLAVQEQLPKLAAALEGEAQGLGEEILTSKATIKRKIHPKTLKIHRKSIEIAQNASPNSLHRRLVLPIQPLQALLAQQDNLRELVPGQGASAILVHLLVLVNLET